jgi:hypothetical protein
VSEVSATCELLFHLGRRLKENIKFFFLFFFDDDGPFLPLIFPQDLEQQHLSLLLKHLPAVQTRNRLYTTPFDILSLYLTFFLFYFCFIFVFRNFRLTSIYLFLPLSI